MVGQADGRGLSPSKSGKISLLTRLRKVTDYLLAELEQLQAYVKLPSQLLQAYIMTADYGLYMLSQKTDLSESKNFNVINFTPAQRHSLKNHKALLAKLVHILSCCQPRNFLVIPP